MQLRGRMKFFFFILCLTYAQALDDFNCKGRFKNVSCILIFDIYANLRNTINLNFITFKFIFGVEKMCLILELFNAKSHPSENAPSCSNRKGVSCQNC